MVNLRLDQYLEKFGWCEQCIDASSSKNLSVIVVIPCFHEPDLLRSLNALWKCERPEGDVEVIVVFNIAEDKDDDVRQEHERSIQEASRWIKDHNDETLTFHLIVESCLPKKHAGVGLARKIGMDEAVRRFSSINKDGLIVCFDADSCCDENYLVAIEHHFTKEDKSPGASIYFEHPTTGEEFSNEVYFGIAKYELFLRYYVHGLRYVGFPYAFHTIGSSMVVRASAYMKQGGMNKRKAGEDFYFLQKIFLLGGFTEINTTCVRPSPRPSNRVPFGTGKQIAKFLQDGSDDYKIYHPNSFKDLKELFGNISCLESPDDAAILLKRLPRAVNSFLVINNVENNLAEIRKNTSNLASFRKRFFQWFNGFMVLKYMHHCRDNHYPQIELLEASRKILELSVQEVHADGNVIDLLRNFRELDRNKTSTVSL